MWVAGCVDRLCEKAGWLTTTPRRRCNDHYLIPVTARTGHRTVFSTVYNLM